MDSNYVRYPSPRLDPKKTVFVGALHGMINAQVNSFSLSLSPPMYTKSTVRLLWLKCHLR